MVSIGEKLILRCTSNTEMIWYKGGEIFKPSSPRIRLMKQSLRFKYIEAEDADSYSCLIKSSNEWRNVTIRIESLQNDGYQHETENLGGHRTEEETNELEIETRS